MKKGSFGDFGYLCLSKRRREGGREKEDEERRGEERRCGEDWNNMQRSGEIGRGLFRGLVERERERKSRKVMKRIEREFGFWLFVPFKNKVFQVQPYCL